MAETKAKKVIPIHKRIPLFIRYFTAEAGQNDIAFKNDKVRPMTTPEYQSLVREALINSGDAADAAEADAISEQFFGYKADVNTDWRDVVTQKGSQSQYGLNISGGNEKTSIPLLETAPIFSKMPGTPAVGEGTLVKSKPDVLRSYTSTEAFNLLLKKPISNPMLNTLFFSQVRLGLPTLSRRLPGNPR